MYTIYLDFKLAFDPLSPILAVGNARLSIDDNDENELTFTMYKNHPMYNDISTSDKTHYAEVYDEHKLIFFGYTSGISFDINGELSIRCSSINYFMKHARIMRKQRTVYTKKEWITWCIENVYNYTVPDFQKIYIGFIEPNAIRYNTVIDHSLSPSKDLYSTINDVLSTDDTRLRFEKRDGKNYMDILKKTYISPKYVISFGENMTNLNGSINHTDRYTGVFVIGGQDDEGDDITLYNYPYSAVAPGYSIAYGLITDDDMVKKYGLNSYELKNSDLTSTGGLISSGLEFLKKQNRLDNLTASAYDMGILSGNEESINVGDYAEIIYDFLGIRENMVCTSIELNLNDPSQSSYSFGRIPDTLTGIIKT